MTGERPWPKKEAGSPPRRRSGPSPTRVQRATARAGMQGAITMHQGLTDSGVNSRVHHFNLSSHGTKKIREPGQPARGGGHVLSGREHRAKHQKALPPFALLGWVSGSWPEVALGAEDRRDHALVPVLEILRGLSHGGVDDGIAPK